MPLRARRFDPSCPPERAAPPAYVPRGPDVHGHGARTDEGVAFPGAPGYERRELAIFDTALPNAAPPVTLNAFALVDLLKHETLHVVRFGQRLVRRTPGAGEAPKGDPTDYLSGTGLSVTWTIERHEPQGDFARGQGQPLYPQSSSSRIVSPYSGPVPWHVLVPGPCRVIYFATVTGTQNVRDKLLELAGFLDCWRYLEGYLPKDAHFLALQTAG